MDELRDRMLRGDLVDDVRQILRSGAADHAQWIRENVRDAITARRQDVVSVSALSGLAPGTVRGFLNGRPSSIDNVLLIAEAVGYTLAELDRPREEFRLWLNGLRDHVDGVDGVAIGASLLAFDEAPTPMAVLLIDGTILKVNRELGELLGYDEGELVGTSGARFSLSTDQTRANRAQELADSGELRGHTVQLKRKDGSQVTVVTSAIVVRDHEQVPRYVIARAAPEDA